MWVSFTPGNLRDRPGPHADARSIDQRTLTASMADANRSWRASLLFLLVFALFPAGAHADLGSLIQARSLSVLHYDAMPARLGDRSVLVAGGINDRPLVYSSPERFDPLSNRWLPAAPKA